MMTYKVNETLTISVSFTKFIILMLCDFVLDQLTCRLVRQTLSKRAYRCGLVLV